MLTVRALTSNKISIINISKVFASTEASSKTMQIPNPKKISTDMIGPVDPVSNLRRIIFKQPPKESDLEKRYRLLRSEVQEWNQTFWTQHNTRFFQEREAYLKKNLPEGQQNLTADEMSVFYKEFLDKNYKAHTNYNVEWYRKNFTLLGLAIKIKFANVLSKLKLVPF